MSPFMPNRNITGNRCEDSLGASEQLDVSKVFQSPVQLAANARNQTGLADGLNVSAYNNLMYTEHDMHDMRVSSFGNYGYRRAQYTEIYFLNKF